MNIGERELWLVVGSQHLCGEEVLREVRKHTQEVVDELNENDQLSYLVRLQELVATANTITRIMKETNYREGVAGVITWMHAFSPAKMWIRGTELLQRPLLHSATQYNESVPWETIDVDFMNPSQSAHGDHEYGFINA